MSKETAALEKRVIALQDIATTDEYEQIGEAAIMYGTYENLPDNIKEILTNLEKQNQL